MLSIWSGIFNFHAIHRQETGGMYNCIVCQWLNCTFSRSYPRTRRGIHPLDFESPSESRLLMDHHDIFLLLRFSSTQPQGNLTREQPRPPSLPLILHANPRYLLLNCIPTSYACCVAFTSCQLLLCQAKKSVWSRSTTCTSTVILGSYIIRLETRGQVRGVQAQYNSYLFFLCT